MMRLQIAFTAAAYIMVVVTTYSAKECTLQLGEKTEGRSVILGDTDIRMCYIDCAGGAFILAWCPQMHDSRQTVMPDKTIPENHHNVTKPSCGSKVCNATSVCLEKGCTKVCVQAPSFCDLHVVSKTGDLAKVKASLSQGRTDIDCKEWNGRTPVLLAAGEGHTNVVHVLVSNGANVSVVDDFGINILHSACQGGDFTLVKYVLSLDKHDINGKVLCGATSAMLAADNGHRNVVELLYRNGANMSLKDESESNILHYACRSGHVEVVKYILSHNMVDINSRGHNCKTPVLTAAEHGQIEVMELLFWKGANMSLKSKSGNNILHYACLSGHVEVVKYILSQKMVDINSRGYMRKAPVLTAAKHGHMEVVEFLFRKGANMSLKSKTEYNILHYACLSGHVEVVKYILSLNMVDINSRGHYGKTPILTAAEHGQTEVLELLFKKGAKVSLKSKNENNILHFACRSGHVGVVKYILSQNMADINSRGYKRKTPVLTAAKHGHMEVVEFLFREGANMSLKSKNENNILHYACCFGYVEMVKNILSQKMVDINSRGYKGKTPVLTAAKHGQIEVVELLFRKGANMSLKSETEYNILHYACHSGHVEVVKYILSLKMVDINSRNKELLTPIMVAAKRGHREVVEFLVSKGADRSL